MPTALFPLFLNPSLDGGELAHEERGQDGPGDDGQGFTADFRDAGDDFHTSIPSSF